MVNYQVTCKSILSLCVKPWQAIIRAPFGFLVEFFLVLCYGFHIGKIRLTIAVRAINTFGLMIWRHYDTLYS
jgi:hypothetical protein